jgi:hypothetical protein
MYVGKSFRNMKGMVINENIKVSKAKASGGASATDLILFIPRTTYSF